MVSPAAPAVRTVPAAKPASTGDAPVIRDDIGPELVSEINFLRTKPAQYAEMLRKDRLPYFRRALSLSLSLSHHYISFHDTLVIYFPSFFFL